MVKVTARYYQRDDLVPEICLAKGLGLIATQSNE